MIRFYLRSLKLRMVIVSIGSSNVIYERDPWNFSGSSFYNERQGICNIGKK